MMSVPESIENLLDVPLEVEVELDRMLLVLKKILELKPGDVLRFRRPAGENVTVRVGGQPVALAEVITIDELLAVRLTELLSETGDSGTERFE